MSISFFILALAGSILLLIIYVNVKWLTVKSKSAFPGKYSNSLIFTHKYNNSNSII